MVMCAGLVKARRIFKYKEVNMGLFSKEECCFCGAKVGVLSRFKIKSGEFMCQDCQKKGNPFMHLASMNKDEIGLLFEECEQGEAHFQEVKNYCRKVSRGTISKTWTIYDNFQTGEFFLETPESHLYPNHFVYKMDAVFPYDKVDQFLSNRTQGGTIEDNKKKYYNLIKVKQNKNSEGKTESWVLRIPYNRENMKIEIKFPGSMEEKDVRLLQSTIQALVGSYNTDKRLTPTQLQEIQKAGVSLGDDNTVTSASDAISDMIISKL